MQCMQHGISVSVCKASIYSSSFVTWVQPDDIQLIMCWRFQVFQQHNFLSLHHFSISFFLLKLFYKIKKCPVHLLQVRKIICFLRYCLNAKIIFTLLASIKRCKRITSGRDEDSFLLLFSSIALSLNPTSMSVEFDENSLVKASTSPAIEKMIKGRLDPSHKMIYRPSSGFSTPEPGGRRRPPRSRVRWRLQHMDLLAHADAYKMHT